MYLEEIVGNVQLENSTVECKSILNREDVVGWLKTIAGFANATGGDMYIGVEDKTNKLIGFDRKAAVLSHQSVYHRSVPLYGGLHPAPDPLPGQGR